MNAVRHDGPKLSDVESYLFQQAEYLDDRDFAAWLNTFTDDGVYWMPFKEGQSDPETEMSIFYEDRALMRARVARLQDPFAWGQHPPTRTSHVIGNVVLKGPDPQTGDLVVRSRFHVTEFRRDILRVFAGRYTHHLRRSGDELKTRLLRVDLINCDGLHEHNIQVFV